MVKRKAMDRFCCPILRVGAYWNRGNTLCYRGCEGLKRDIMGWQSIVGEDGRGRGHSRKAERGSSLPSEAEQGNCAYINWNAVGRTPRMKVSTGDAHRFRNRRLKQSIFVTNFRRVTYLNRGQGEQGFSWGRLAARRRGLPVLRAHQSLCTWMGRLKKGKEKNTVSGKPRWTWHQILRIKRAIHVA